MTFATGTIYYVPVTITNSQTTATPSTFQTMVTVNSSNYTSYLASNLQNVNWQDGSGNILNSWLESGNSNSSTSSVYWVKLTTSIPASSSTTIYLCFYSTTTNNFNTTTTGEAPTLSGTYGQYDNGANVFSNYWNFAGTTNPAGWTNSLGSASYNNGVTFSGQNGAYLYNTTTYSGDIVIDGQWKVTSQASTTNYGEGAIGLTSTSGITWDTTFGATRLLEDTSPIYGYIVYGTGGPLTNTVPLNTNVVLTFMGSSSEMNFLGDYVSQKTYASAIPSSYYLLGANCDGGASGVLQWFRTRVYPPNATMPSSSFGAISILHTITKSLHYEVRGHTALTKQIIT